MFKGSGFYLTDYGRGGQSKPKEGGDAPAADKPAADKPAAEKPAKPKPKKKDD